MPQETHSVVSAAQGWLRSTWHVQVPFVWLQACVQWLQGEAGGAGHLSQQQLNQQVSSVLAQVIALLVYKMFISVVKLLN